MFILERSSFLRLPPDRTISRATRGKYYRVTVKGGVMARYRSDREYERDYDMRENRERGDNPWNQDERYGERRFYEEQRRPDYRSDYRADYRPNRFGERADYNPDEPRYSNFDDRPRDEHRRSSLEDVRGDLGGRRTRGYYEAGRSRTRCRDIMTRELVVATRDTTIGEIAMMMKQEDTGVIPVVEYDVPGNGRAVADERIAEARNQDKRQYSRGRLVGLVTDRDIVVRAVADNKDCATVRAEDVMSKDIKTGGPNDRVADVIRKMGEKQVRRIPIVNESGYLMGMVSMADVSRETEDDRELGETLEEISKGPSFWSRIFS